MDKQIEYIAEALKLDLPDFECPDIGQTPAEIINNLKIVRQLDPKVILEIGSATGGFFYMLSAALSNKKRTFISIDPWTEGTKYERQYHIYDETINNLKKFYPNNQYFRIRRRSEDVRATEELKIMLKDQKIDFLFIDGAHTYQSVMNDWLNYSQFLNEKSVVAFHDIVEYGEVNQAWKEISSQNNNYTHQEFKEEGIPLLTSLGETDAKFSKPIVLGVGYLFKN
ncbi:MAG TPA: class I SAM-dependent methyltransferase [Candidatus Paceibacterota bacterium]|nr:class I SAM-dependent methyltransferase [Candidatus Paceibacterota bacterium]